MSTLQTIIESLKIAMNDNAPVDFSVYAFANRVARIVDKADTYNAEAMAKAYEWTAHQLGGGTDLAQSVTAITEDLKERAGHAEKIALVITDAEVYQHHFDELVNQAKTEDVKYIFIAINAQERNMQGDSARILFNGRNLTDPEEAVKIIKAVLLDSIDSI